MKLINKVKSKLSIEFNQNELELLDRVLEVPLSAFGLDRLLVETGLKEEKIRSIKYEIADAIKEKSLVLTFEVVDYFKLKEIYKVACNIIDKNEMHTLTGYSWEEALGIQKSLNIV